MKLSGVDFGEQGAKTLKATVRTNGKGGVIRISKKLNDPTAAGYLPVESDGNEVTVCTTTVEGLQGVTDVYFTFSGEGYEILDWIFE